MANEGGKQRRAAGMGTTPIWDERRGRYVVRVTMPPRPGEKQRRSMVTGRTKAEVEARAAELRRKRDLGIEVSAGKMTVAEYVAEWLAHGRWAPATRANYSVMMSAYVLPSVGRERLDKLNSRHVRTMMANLERSGRAPNTVRLARTILGAAMRQALADGFITRNPVPAAKGPAARNLKEGRTLSVTQAKQLLEYVATHRLGTCITLGLLYGLRRGELLGLSWPDVYLDRRRFHVRRQLQRLPKQGLWLAEVKTSSSERTMTLTASLAARLRALRLQQAYERDRAGAEWQPLPGMEHLVFTSALGRPVDPGVFGVAFKEITEAAGIGRWTPHEMRHSAASLLLGHGVPLERVSDYLGHANIHITADVYRHALGHEMGDVTETLASILDITEVR